jgi:hypothetical protein
MDEISITADDLLKIAKTIYELNGVNGPYETALAIVSGWRQDEYMEVYKKFLASTQVDLTKDNCSTEVKARPLENLGRYLLDQGGFAADVRSISYPSVWQVDGMGKTRLAVVDMIFGCGISSRFGPQVFFEGKNHQEAMTGGEFSEHCARMHEHDCKCGVVLSVSGYKIKDGKGIAARVYPSHCRGEYHLLLSPKDLSMIADGTAPLERLKESYLRAADDRYRQKDGRDGYEEAHCHDIIGSEVASRLDEPKHS